MTLYHLDSTPRLDSPIVVAAFDGWVDGGRAGTLAADQLAEGGHAIATFDTDRIYDYRARRPTLQIINGKLMDLDWPQLRLVATRIGERDLLVLTGAEPDYLWRQLQTDVVGLAKELGVVTWVSLGAIPATVPHTRPVPILGTASTAGLLPQDVPQGPDGELRVPSALVSVLELAVS